MAKKAAIEVISALTIGDHFGVVTFSSKATSLNKYLIKATKENKNKMINTIKSIGIGEGTNYYAAFESAFTLLEDSVAQEFTSGCKKAMLFLTDGDMTFPRSGLGSNP